METTPRLVILGVAESDAHAVANRLICAQLQAHGFSVLNLGVCTPLSQFAAALRRHPQAEAVLIGSVNGHAHADLRQLPVLRAAGELGRPVVVGGNLSVGSHKNGSEVQRLYDLGVDHVLADVNELVLLLDQLHAAAGAAADVGGSAAGSAAGVAAAAAAAGDVVGAADLAELQRG